MIDWQGWLVYDNDHAAGVDEDGSPGPEFDAPGLFLALVATGCRTIQFNGRSAIDVAITDGRAVTYWEGDPQPCERTLDQPATSVLLDALVDSGCWP